MSINIKEHVPLAPATTFEIGGTARYLVDVRSESEIKEALEWAREKKVASSILSGGSNVLVPDGGMEALVVRLVGNLWCVGVWSMRGREAIFYCLSVRWRHSIWAGGKNWRVSPAR